MQRWVFPVPVPPMKIALRLASRKAPEVSSRTWPSSTGVSAKTNLSMSLRTGNFAPAMAIADRACLSVGALGADQAVDQRIKLVAPGKALAGDLVEAGGHAVELKFAHRLQNLMAFHQAIFLMRS